MILNKNIASFLISDICSVRDALAKIDNNKQRIAFVVDQKNCLVGSLSDGDIRRWLISGGETELECRVGAIANKSCVSASINSTSETIEKLLNHQIIAIPLVDDNNRIVAIAQAEPAYFEVGKKIISKESPAFIIAEIGNNHQGDMALAKELVGLAMDAGVDCVKFQMRNMKKLYKNSGDAKDSSADLGTQYTLDLLAKFQLQDNQLFELFDYCKEIGILPLCTPWDIESLNKLEAYGMDAYKVASADFTNYELLEQISNTRKLMICSTGMSSESEIQSTVAFLKRKNAQFVLLHCNSTYPTPFKDVNLKYLERLSDTSNSLVGYSGHERGIAIPIAAVACGAKVIEKHLTLDKSLEGNDHKVSLLPHELNTMVEQIRQVEEAMGLGGPREITQGEMMNREVLAKSLIINRELEIGETITLEMIDVKSPGQGLQPNRIQDLIGKKAIRNFQPGDMFYESDIDGFFEFKPFYTFNRPYGIPVRYHDFKKLTSEVKLDFVEFHLSYRDLDINIHDVFESAEEIGFAVHAPELFEGDHLLDLSAADEKYRGRSISELRRVIDHTLELKCFFPKTDRPVVIVNAGGWNTEGFIEKSSRKKKYDIIESSLNELELDGLQIAIQTMPPFPWHFGGQSYHNLFMDPHEINEFCERTGSKICLDVSHTMMACNHFGWDLYEFSNLVSEHVVHLHIVDAKGADGEGVQIGQGDVDFQKLGKLIDKKMGQIQFIPEVWQGHKNHGSGFWKALSYLENKWKN